MLSNSEQTIMLARTALRDSSVFMELPENEIEKLARSARLQETQKKRLLAYAGTAPEYLWYVIKGQIVLEALTESGDGIEFAPISQGQWTSWIGVLGTRAFGLNYWLGKGSRLLAFPASTLLATAQSHPIMYRKILDEVGGRLQSVITWMWRSNVLEGERRVAALLLLYASVSSGGNKKEFAVTQESMSRVAGCSRQSMNQFLGAMEKRGLVELRYGSIQLTDVAKLEEFANSPGIE